MSAQPWLFVSSGDLRADRRFALAQDLSEQGDRAAAIDLLIQTLELAPGFASAWFALGTLRAAAGDREGAVEAFTASLRADPDDRQGARLHLQRLGAKQLTGMPPAYVRTLFDQYAPRFDAALVGRLAYRAPEALREAVTRARDQQGRPARFAHMLDLGCGTGLAGAAFRDMTGRMTGVDLSPGMVALAERRGIYDRLAALDLVAFLHAEETARTAPADLIVAADVLAYFADLAPVTEAVSRRLARDGVFAFTVETHDGEGVILAETLRYAHAADYVGGALAQGGLAPLTMGPVSSRTEKGVPVPGLVVVAQPAGRPPSPA